jgi:hypothetical protein
MHRYGRRSAAPGNLFSMQTQGSQRLALGLTMTAASQLVGESQNRKPDPSASHSTQLAAVVDPSAQADGSDSICQVVLLFARQSLKKRRQVGALQKKRGANHSVALLWKLWRL